MKKAIIAIAALLVAVPAGLAAWLATLDPEDYSAEISREISARTGRAVTLGGAVTIAWGLSPTFAVSEIAVANADWGSEPEMLRLDHAELSMRLLPLLSGEVDVKRIHARGAWLLVETDADGRSNWDLGPGAGDASPGNGAPAAIALSRLDTNDLVLVVRDAAGSERTVEVKRLDIRAGDARGAYRLEGELSVNAVAIAVSGTMSDPRANPFVFDLEASAKGLKVTKAGRVADLATGEGLDAAVDVTVDDGETLSAVLGVYVAKLAPFTLRSKVAGEYRRFTLRGLDVAVAGTRATGSVDVDLRGERPRLTGSLASDAVDLQPLFASDADAAPAGGRLIPDTPFDAPAAFPVDAQLNLAATSVTLPRMAIDNASARVTVDPTRIHVDPFSAVIAGSAASGTLTLEPHNGGYAISTALRAPGLDLAQVAAVLGLADSLEGTGELNGELSGRGTSPAALAATVDGELRFTLGHGRARLQGIDTVVGGLSGLLSARGSDGAGWTELSCGALGADFDDGVGETRLLVDADAAVVSGDGTVNLGDETLDLLLSPEAKSATLNVSVPVHVYGPFASPSLEPDAAAVGRRIGALAGSVLFPPAALLAFADSGAAEDPCLQQAAEVKAKGDRASLSRKAGEVADTTREVAGKAAEGAGKAIDSITSGLKSLFGGGSPSGSPAPRPAPREPDN